MKNEESRMERFYDTAVMTAESGSWRMQLSLYSSEARRLERQWGVTVLPLTEWEKGKETECRVSWWNAFGQKGITYKQSWYISFILDEMPETENFAQKLYLLAARARKY